MTARTRRRPAAVSTWGRLQACPLCDTRLIWPVHTPKAMRRTKAGPARAIPLDADPTDDPAAPYAVSLGRTRSRWLDDDEDPDVTESRHHSHIYTCPAGVTPEVLASLPPQNGTLL